MKGIIKTYSASRLHTALFLIAVFLLAFSTGIMLINVYPSSTLLFTLVVYPLVAFLLAYLTIRLTMGSGLLWSFLLSFAVRLTWVIIVNPVPVSDFMYYYTFFQEIVRDEPVSGVPAQPFFWYILASLLKPFGLYEIIPISVVLIILQSLTGLVIALALKPFSKKAALTASYLWALYPADVFFAGVIATDIPEAFFVAVLLLLATRWYLTQQPRYLILVGVVALFIALTRKAGLFMLPLVFLVPFLSPANSSRYWIKKLRNSFYLVKGTIYGLLAILILASISNDFSLPRKEYLWGEPNLFPLLSGTNYASRGMWNPQDVYVYFSVPDSLRLQMVIDSASQRLLRTFSNPNTAVTFIGAKLKHLWDNYGIYWSVHIPYSMLKKREIPQEILEDFSFFHDNEQLLSMLNKDSVLTVFQSIESGGRIAILLLAIMGTVYLYYMNKKRFIFLYMSTGALVIYIIAHIIFEAQGRYHHMLLPFVFAVAAWAICVFQSCIYEHTLTTKQPHERNHNQSQEEQ